MRAFWLACKRSGLNHDLRRLVCKQAKQTLFQHETVQLRQERWNVFCVFLEDIHSAFNYNAVVRHLDLVVESASPDRYDDVGLRLQHRRVRYGRKLWQRQWYWLYR